MGPTTHVQLGRVLAAEGKSGEAAEELQAWNFKADPGDPHAALELGSLYLQAGKDSEAERQFESPSKFLRTPRRTTRSVHC